MKKIETFGSTTTTKISCNRDQYKSIGTLDENIICLSGKGKCVCRATINQDTD